MKADLPDPKVPGKTERKKACDVDYAHLLAEQAPAHARYNADNLGYFAVELMF